MRIRWLLGTILTIAVLGIAWALLLPNGTFCGVDADVAVLKAAFATYERTQGLPPTSLVELTPMLEKTHPGRFSIQPHPGKWIHYEVKIKTPTCKRYHAECRIDENTGRIVELKLTRR